MIGLVGSRIGLVRPEPIAQCLFEIGDGYGSNHDGADQTQTRDRRGQKPPAMRAAKLEVEHPLLGGIFQAPRCLPDVRSAEGRINPLRLRRIIRGEYFGKVEG